MQHECPGLCVCHRVPWGWGSRLSFNLLNQSSSLLTVWSKTHRSLLKKMVLFSFESYGLCGGGVYIPERAFKFLQYASSFDLPSLIFYFTDLGTLCPRNTILPAAHPQHPTSSCRQTFAQTLPLAWQAYLLRFAYLILVISSRSKSISPFYIILSSFHLKLDLNLPGAQQRDSPSSYLL
jgi:hypothetical protein